MDKGRVDDKRIGVFLQARMGSTRFPGKVVATLKPDWTVLDHAMSSLAGITADVYAVLTDGSSFAALGEIVKRWRSWEILRGHPTDVMKRFIDAAHHYNIDVIVRACGDNPFVDYEVGEWALNIHLESTAHATRIIGGDLGTAIEIVNTDALVEAYEGASTRDREHVMAAIWGSGEKINILNVDPIYGESVTVDEPEDLERVRRIYDQLTT